MDAAAQIEEIRELHFLNSSRFEAGKFSCAIDCFLELWLGKVSYFWVTKEKVILSSYSVLCRVNIVL